MEEVYYQPVLKDEEWGVRLYSFEVYHDFMRAKQDFPDCVIAVYSGDDIEDPTYVDSEDDGTVNVCSDCGSTDVEFKAWVHCKTGAVGTVSSDREDTWCNNCQDHTGLDIKILEEDENIS